ncbi:MAG: hypothetical protein JWN30_1676 [Bacilli bacterium]|nr:hypothetical protein [Bacilli bacterium]
MRDFKEVLKSDCRLRLASTARASAIRLSITQPKYAQV